MSYIISSIAFREFSITYSMIRYRIINIILINIESNNIIYLSLIISNGVELDSAKKTICEERCSAFFISLV